jgi:hypothetical protein
MVTAWPKAAVLSFGLLLCLLQSSCSGSSTQARIYPGQEGISNQDAGNDQSAAAAGFGRKTVLTAEDGHDFLYKGQKGAGKTALAYAHGLVLPDGRGGVVVMPGQKAAPPDPDFVDARELKLKMRELAAQLVVDLPRSLSSYIAMPVSFVAQDDFESSSSLGRFIVEQMLYEFNHRGLLTRETRMTGKLTVRDDGEFILSRQNGVKDLDGGTLYLTGTYYTDQNTIFINARLIRAGGRIIRAGQIIMPLTPLTRRMLATSGKKIPEQSLEIMDFEQEARPVQNRTAFDLGLDIH